MGLFGKSKKEKEAEAKRNRQREVRYKIDELENSFAYKTPFLTCEAYVHTDDDALTALTDYLTENKRLVKNDDFMLSKSELAEHYGEIKLYNYLPVPLDYRYDGERVFVRYDDDEYKFIGTLPSDKVTDILDLKKQSYSEMKVCFYGTKYKELTTEDFEHYDMDKDEEIAIMVSYRKKNPEHDMIQFRIDRLKQELEQ